MKKFSKNTVITVIITCICTLAAVNILSYFGIYVNDSNFPKLTRIMEIIEEEYVGTYTKDECENAAINAVLGSIGDKYAVYYNEENAKETMQNIDGFYTGIGVEVFANTQENIIEVLSVYEDSPADKAGMLQGDRIVSVDQKIYTADKLADAVLHIKGIGVPNATQTPVVIEIERNNEKKKLTVKRAKVGLYEVKSEIVDNICYIRYTGFSPESYKKFKEIVDLLDFSKITGLVVDVRSNPGGEFNSALKMCDMFLDEETIIYTLDKDGNKTVYKGTQGKIEVPLAVIVSKNSASASEIFAGSLQANKRAVVIGEDTYGKGETQTVMYLNGKDAAMGALKLTTYRNYTPDGKWINEKIKPDVYAEAGRVNGDIREDAAFKVAFEYLNKEK